MNRCPSRLSVLGAVVAGSLLGGHVQAQDQPLQLQSTEVTASPESGERHSVEAQTLARYQASDLEDVFSSDVEVNVGGGHSAAQKLYLRGIEDTLLNISIDGAQQAGQVFHHTGRISIEPELLKRADIQSGTGDATAGPGALGGSIRFVTKDPEDLLRPGQQMGALVKGTYYSNAEGYKVNTSLYGRFNQDWSGMLVATYQDQNDYDDGNGDQVFGTGARQQLGFAKLVGQLTPDQTLRLSYDRREDQGERTQRPQWVVSGFNRAYPLKSVRETYTLNHAWQPLANPLLALETTLYHTTTELTQDVFDRWGKYHGEVESTGMDLRNTSELGSHRITYGIDYRDDKVTAGPTANRSENKETGSVMGLYVQDSIRMTRDLLLGLGLRYDRYRLDDATDQSFKDTGFSPNVNLRYELTPNLSLLAGHSRALRGPKIRDAFKLDSAANDPNLKAEKARTSELGFEYEQGDWSLGGKLYRTDIRDVIADFLGGPRLYENSGDLRSKGFVLNTAYHWSQVSAGISFHRNDARIDGQRLNVYEHNGLGTSMGDTWILHSDWRASERLELGWQGRFVRRLDNLRTSVGTVDKPGYGVHDLYLSWQPLQQDQLTLSLTLKNVFDKQYLDHASNEDFEGIPGYDGVVGSAEAGREWRIGLAWRY